MNKVDFKKTLPAYAARVDRFDDIVIAPMQYLMIDGEGDPNSGCEYADALATLYPVAYALKFASKNDLGRDYVVPPLEALWWADDMAVFTSARDKSAWSWTAMLMTPDWLGADVLEAAMEHAANKDAPALDLLRLATLDEGRCIQTLHVGSYDDEGPVFAHLHNELIPSLGLQMTGTHHEIYLSDTRRTVPHKLRTILRQPVATRD